MKLPKLGPLCKYQGGKRRYAETIVDQIFKVNPSPSRVYDFGVGSGAVTIALVARGYNPRLITAVDTGPWGNVWRAFGDGTFDVGALALLVSEVQIVGARDAQRWAEIVLTCRSPTPEVFVVLQAASFGGAPVWRDVQEMRWRVGETGWNYVSGGYWEPGPDSPETKPRSWAISMPKTIVAMAERLAKELRGLDARQCKAEDVQIEPNSVVYIDPPYEGVWGYGTAMDWRSIVDKHRPVLVSEARCIDGASQSLQMKPRRAGSFKGALLGRPLEWLNVWEAS